MDGFVYDKKLKTIALKRGNISVYIIPEGINVKGENFSDLRIY